MKKTSSEKSATARKSKSRPGVKTGASKKIQRAEHKLAPSQTLQDSEIRYRRLFEAAQDGILILDAQTGAIDDVNPYLIDMLGYSRAEFLKKKLWEVGAFKDVDASKFKFNTLQKKGYVRYENLPLRAKGGQLIQVEFVSNVYLVGSQKVVQCNIRDTTARVKAEQAAQLHDRRFQALIENATDALTLLDAQGNIIYDSPALPGMLGYAPGEWIGRKVFEIFHPDDFQKSQDLFQNLLNTPGKRVESVFRVRHKSGTWLWIEGFATNLLEEPAVNAIVLNYRDITERKRAEEALRESEDRYRVLVEQSPDMIGVIEEQGLVYLNKSGAKLLGAERPEQVLGKNPADLVHPDDLPTIRERSRQASEKRVSNPLVQFRLIRLDGAAIQVESTSMPLVYQGKRATQFIARDVTERNRAEEARRASEALYRNLFENMLDGFAYCKMIFEQGRPQDFIYLDVNRAFETLTGLKNVVGKKVSEVIPGIRETDPELFEIYGRVALTGLPEVFETYLEALKMWFSISVYSPEKEFFVAVFDVITDRKQAEEALRASEARFRGLFEDSPISLWEEDFSAVKRRLDAMRVEGITDFPAYFASHPEVVAECVALIKILDVNNATLKLFGANRKEEMLKNLGEISKGVPPPEFVDEFINIAAGKTKFNWEGLNKTFDGRLISVEANWSAAPGFEDSLSRVNLSMVDITERKQAEEALRASETRYRGLFEDSPIALWEEDFSAVKRRLDALRAEGITDFPAYFASHPEVVTECAALIKVLDVNKATLKLFVAFRKEELLKNLALIFGGEPPPTFIDELSMIAAGQTRFHHEDFNRRLDGKLINVEIDWSVAPGHEKSLSKVNISMIDITERKQAEEALMHERNLIRTLIDIVPDIIFAKDMEGRFLLKNAADARRMGASSPEETIGKTDFDYYPHDLAAHYSADDEIVLRSGQPIVDRQELTVDAAGHSGWLSTTKVPLRDAHGEVIGLVGIGHDITERKQAEKLQDAVFRIASAAVTPGSLDDLYAEIHRIISDVMPAENFYITLYDEDRDLLTFPYFQDTFDKNFQDEVHPQKGLTAYVLRTGKSLLCTQAVHDDLERRGEVKLLGTASSIWLGVPLSLQGKVIGAMVVQHYTDPEAYGEREQHMLEYVSGQVATAISRKRAEEGIQRQLARLAALHDIDQFVSSSFDLHMTLNEILKHVKKELGVDAADVLLLNSTSLFLEYGAGLGFRTKQVEKASVRLGQSLAGAIALKRELVHIANLNDQAPDMWLKTQLAGEGFVGYCGVPLIVKGGVRGVLEVYHRSPLKPDQEWFDFLNTLAGQAAIAIDNALLFENLQRSNVDLTLAYDATIEGWSRAMDLRDKETEGHTLRVTEITMELAGLFGIKDEDLTGIRRGALLHDIGKMGVPDAILFKPGPLTDEEWILMKKHPVQAFDMLSPIRYLQSALEIPYCHHEKWDGTGYPRGLKGKQIPLPARIFALVDVWDALTSDRPYRQAWSHEKAIEYIRSESGIHFDPEVVNVCLKSGVFDRKRPNQTTSN